MGDAFYIGDTFFSATPSFLATPFFVATPSFLATPFFVATPSFLATPSLLATPIAASNEENIKTKNQGKVFSQTCFFFYLGDLIKKPREGKKSVPFNKTVTSLLT